MTLPHPKSWHSPHRIGRAKAALRASFTMEEEAGLRGERESFGIAFASEDRVEGTEALVTKRTPSWRHK